MDSPPHSKQHRELQAAQNKGRTRLWSRLPGILAVLVGNKDRADTTTMLNLPPSALSRPSPLSIASDPIPSIEVDSSEVFFGASTTLPEAAGVIDPTLLHAPFLREPLFVPVPGSGRRALERWYPEPSHGNIQRPRLRQSSEHTPPHQIQSSLKYWLHYAEPELYQGIMPGQALQLFSGNESGHKYEVCWRIGPVGPGVAFWAEPVQNEELLPQAVVLFLPPGAYCSPYTRIVLQERALEAAGFAGYEPSTSPI